MKPTKIFYSLYCHARPTATLRRASGYLCNINLSGSPPKAGMTIFADDLAVQKTQDKKRFDSCSLPYYFTKKQESIMSAKSDFENTDPVIDAWKLEAILFARSVVGYFNNSESWEEKIGKLTVAKLEDERFTLAGPVGTDEKDLLNVLMWFEKTEDSIEVSLTQNLSASKSSVYQINRKDCNIDVSVEIWSMVNEFKQGLAEEISLQIILDERVNNALK